MTDVILSLLSSLAISIVLWYGNDSDSEYDGANVSKNDYMLGDREKDNDSNMGNHNRNGHGQ